MIKKLTIGMIATLMLSASAWADLYIIPMSKQVPGGIERGVVARTISAVTDKITINTPPGNYTYKVDGVVKAGGTPLVVSGSHKIYTDDGTLVGEAVNTGGGSGGPPGGKLDGPTQGSVEIRHAVELRQDQDGNVIQEPWGVPGMFFVDADGIHSWADLAGMTGWWWQLDPDGGNKPVGITFTFYDNQSLSYNSYVIPLPFCSGTFVFVGNSTSGFFPSAADNIKIGSFSISGPKRPSINPQVLKALP